MIYVNHFFYLFSIEIIITLLTKIKSKPIFGILSSPEPINDTTTFINESIAGPYIIYLESAGA